MPVELNVRFTGRDSVSVFFDDIDTGALTFNDPLTKRDHADIRWYVEIYGAHSLGDPDDEEAARIKARLPVLGQRLFDAVFREHAARRLFDRFQDREADTRLLTITAEDAAILALPWELLNHKGTDDGFLFWENPRISIRRRIAGATDGRTTFRVEPKDTLHLLFVVSRPAGSGFLDPRADPGAVLDALDEHAPGRVTVEFLRPATLDALTRRLEDAGATPVDILHFDGHGVLDERGGLPTFHREQTSRRRDGIASEVHRKSDTARRQVPADEPPNSGYLLFEDDAGECDFVSADKLGRNLHRHRISLVILSACQSAKVGTGEDADTAEGEARPMGSVAARLTATGIPAVLAMTHSVLAVTTRQLFGRLYEELARHKHLGEALDNARRRLFDHPGKYHVQRGAERRLLKLHDWFLPALYEPGNDAPLLRQQPSGAPSRAPSKRSSNLPARPEAGFFGRRRELWQIERWLARGTKRVTVSGFGGQGKTALAAEAGRWLVRSGLFRTAVFVDYSRIQSADAVRIAVNEVGSVLDETFGDADAVTFALAQTPTLVILDNLEALADEPLHALLTAAVPWSMAGGSRVLCTTRRPDLRHPDYRDEGTHLHRRVALNGLGDKAHPDDVLEWFAALSQLPPAPTQPPPARDALIELFDRVRFHPLSIRVLARQLKTEHPSRLGTRLAEILGDPRIQASAKKIEDTPEGLVASLQLSLERLNAEARAILPRLGVFQGGAFEDALLAITELGDEKRTQLSALLAAAESGDLGAILHMMGGGVEGEMPPALAAQVRGELPRIIHDLRQTLARLPQPDVKFWKELRRQLEEAALIETEVVPGVQVPYLRFHPTLAPMLREQLSDDERSRLAADHRGRYAQLARFLYDQDDKAPDEVRAIARLELPNLLHAVHSALDHAEPEAVHFANCVNRFLTLFGLRQEAEALLARAESASGEAGSRAWYLAQSGRGEQLFAHGRQAAAAEVFESILQQLGATPTYDRAATLSRLGRCVMYLGRLDLAVDHYREAIGVLDGLKPAEPVKRLRGVCFTELGGSFAAAGRYGEAREAYDEGLKASRELHDLRSQGVTLSQLGALALEEHNLEEAVAQYRAALPLFQRLAEPAAEAVIWHQMGLAFQEAAQWEEAERHYRESARIAEQQGDMAAAAQTWNQLGIVSRVAAKPTAAEDWFRKAIEGGKRGGDVLPAARSIFNLADLLLTRPGRVAEARVQAVEALGLMKTLDPGAAEIWLAYAVLAKIADREAAEAPDDRRAPLRMEARRYRQLARDARRSFPGTRTQLHRFAPLVVATVLSATGDSSARQTFAAMRQTAPAGLAAALDGVLAGERDAESLCADLDADGAMVIEYILEALANPAALQQWVPQNEG